MGGGTKRKKDAYTYLDHLSALEGELPFPKQSRNGVAEVISTVLNKRTEPIILTHSPPTIGSD